ncbi:MAG TPA: SOS response-associated peptidase [Noviherbaspirillum sp.]
MCERYALHHTPQLLQQWYGAAHVCEFLPHSSLIPGADVPVVRGGKDGRIMETMQWGFIPSWVDTPTCSLILSNARSETAAEKPMFRQAFRQRRCLIPASGFYLWRNATRLRPRQLYYVSRVDEAPMSFAGLWEATTSASGETITYCAIVTGRATPELETVQPRMPVLLDPEHWDGWLNAGEDVPQLRALLQSAQGGRLQLREVDDSEESTPPPVPDRLAPAAASSCAPPCPP